MALMEYGDYDDNQLMSYIQAQGQYVRAMSFQRISDKIRLY